MATTTRVLETGPIYKLSSRIYSRFNYDSTRCPFCGGRFIHNDEVIVAQTTVNGHRRAPMFFHNDEARKCFTLTRMQEEINKRMTNNYLYSEGKVKAYGEEKKSETGKIRV